VNAPDFPAEYKPETLAGVEFLNVLRGEKELDWTFLSPSYFFAPGERTGKFRLGKTNFWLLLTAKAAYPPKTLRSHSWMSWNSRSTLANDSRLGTDN
jgi:hypothetical protein